MKKTSSNSIYIFDPQSRHAIVDKLIMKDDYRSFTNEIIQDIEDHVYGIRYVLLCLINTDSLKFCRGKLST